MAEPPERTAASRPLLLVEDDAFLRLLAVILDPDTPDEMVAAFADFMAHDEPDFLGWRERVRGEAGALFPAHVALFRSTAELLAQIARADALVVESERIGPPEIAAATRLRLVQKYGVTLRNIDVAACAARALPVLTIRRRANIQCAEHVFALMLALARKLAVYGNRLVPSDLADMGHTLRGYDRRFTPNGNWARVPGLRALAGSTLGIIGLGEIGREVALRATAFGMRTLYHQRTRLPETSERELAVRYVPLDELLAQSDWVVPQLPASPETFHLLDRGRIARMKAGAVVVNVSRPDVIDRVALIEALRAGHLGGLGLDPPYESPGREGDELLALDNVIVTPHLGGSPRQNALADFRQMIIEMAHVLARGTRD